MRFLALTLILVAPVGGSNGVLRVSKGGDHVL